MAWLELRLECAADAAERLSDALLDAGALSTGVEDADAGQTFERAVFGEPGQAPPGVWQRNIVTALVEADSDAHALVRAAAVAAGLAAVPGFASRRVEDQDWVRATQSQFEPIQVSRRLWIVPSWHAPPDPNALAVRVDPGLAFGTGSHPTTRLCLEWLDLHIAPAQSVLDYGCGSGILAIAAALLGAAPVHAVDIDEQALIACRDNALANACTIDVRHAATSQQEAADIVVANILANPLIVLAPAIAGLVRPGGRLVLSGILNSQVDEVVAAYAPRVALDVFASREGWTCLHGCAP